MITVEGVLVAVGWTVSMLFGFFVYPRLAAKATMKKFGLVAVKNAHGDEIYAVEGPDGDPIQVPVQRTDKNGQTTVTNEFVPLAYALPVIAAVQTKAFLTSTIQGKSGRMKQIAEQAVLGEMPIDQAAQALAMQAFMKGQIFKGAMALAAPHLARMINASGNAGQEAASSPRSGSKAI